MFTQKKSFFKRKIFYVVLALLLGFGYWVNQMPDKEEIGTNVQVPSDEKPSETKNNEISQKLGEKAYGSEIPEATSQAEEYYLLKEVNGVIQLFHYDAEGNESLLQSTDISFSLISEADQELFSEGIVLYTEEELLDLLQDFES